MNAKKSLCLPLLLVLGSLLSAALAQQNGLSWGSLKPDKAPSPAKVLVTGKQLLYYPLEKGQEILVTVQGPTTLKVLSRLEFGIQNGGEKRYYLHYEREDGKKGKFRRSATSAAGAVLANDQNIRLGNSRDFFLKVPEGKHTYKFSLGAKASYKLYLRFYERSAQMTAGSQNVVFAPSQFTRPITLVIKEEETIYYRVGSQDSLKVSLIGPASLQVLARLEFDPTMINEQKFRVRVFEDGREKGVHALRSKPSEVTQYREKSDRLVGAAAKFFVEIPRGKHEYRFEIMDGGRSVLLRFLIPRKDLINNS
jgi:hypothetical protein